MDNFDFEEDFNDEYENETFESADHLDDLKDRLARANYNAIIKHGIDKDKTGEPEMIVRIIEETMFYFEELEEYEKCAELKREIELFK